MSAHTSEPWKQGALDSMNLESGRLIRGFDDTWIADVHWFPDDEPTPERAAENARRIVACVNACAGMDTPRLEEVVKARATVTFLLADADRLAQAEALLRDLASIFNELRGFYIGATQLRAFGKRIRAFPEGSQP